MIEEESYFEKEKPDFEDTYNGFRLQGHYFAPLEKERGKGYRVDALKDDDAFSVMGIVKPIEMAKKDYREEEEAEKDREMVKKQMQEQTRAEVEERIDEGNPMIDSGEIDLDGDCPYCGENHVLQRAEGYQLVRAGEDEDGSKTIDVDRGTPVMAVFCTNCEGLHLFLAPRK